jgi:3-oxoacyl-[acyl-carrier-protein] synthase II
MKRRVVITGLGLVSPLGIGVEQSWQALCQGKSGVARITLFDPSPLRTQIGGEVKNFTPENFIDKKMARRMDRFVQFAMVAANMAAEDARL